MSHYALIQYVPDAAADERINVGVIAFDSDGWVLRSVSDWKRVKQFASTDLSLVRSLLSNLRNAQAAGQSFLPAFGATDAAPTLESVARIAAEGSLDSIQLATPKASTLSASALVESLGDRFVRKSERRRRVRDRRTAVRLARDSLKSAVDKAPAAGLEVLTRRFSVEGSHEAHEFDLGLKNGRVLVAGRGISFEVRDRRDLKQEIDALAWALDDVRKADSLATPDLAVVVLPPTRTGEVRKTLSSATRLFEDLGASVVPEADLPTWSENYVSRATAART